MLPAVHAQQGEQPPAAAAAGGGGVTDALLGDYVSLGILEDPAAAAAKAEATAARRSARPELLTAVPWAGVLKGVRSPLLRLHQGESHAFAGGLGCLLGLTLACTPAATIPPPAGAALRPGPQQACTCAAGSPLAFPCSHHSVFQPLNS